VSNDAGARISGIDDGARDVGRTTGIAGNDDIPETPSGELKDTAASSRLSTDAHGSDS